MINRWHTDREEIGRATPIASVSLGATRTFLLRHKLNGMSDRASVEMEAGSVLYMENVCQTEYLHSVPKQSEVAGGRINLTFRCKAAGQDQRSLRVAYVGGRTLDAPPSVGKLHLLLALLGYECGYALATDLEAEGRVLRTDEGLALVTGLIGELNVDVEG